VRVLRTHRAVSCVQLTIDAGKVPTSKLCPANSCLSIVRLPSASGREPSRRLYDRKLRRGEGGERSHCVHRLAYHNTVCHCVHPSRPMPCAQRSDRSARVATNTVEGADVRGHACGNGRSNNRWRRISFWRQPPPRSWVARPPNERTRSRVGPAVVVQPPRPVG
jgi:hypothetical protein